MSKERGIGLFNKYTVTKTDGSPVDPKAVYLVLRLDTDKHARNSAWDYCARISTSDDTREFAIDLRDLLMELGEFGMPRRKKRGAV